MKKILLAMNLILLCSCGATGPVFERKIDSNMEGQAEIIIFRKNQFVDGGSCYQINIDQDKLGILANGGFLRAFVEPGQHDIRVFHVKNQVLNLPVNSYVGSTTYIEYSSSLAGGYIIPIGNIVSTSISFQNTLAEVESEYALSALKTLKDSLLKPSCMATVSDK